MKASYEYRAEARKSLGYKWTKSPWSTFALAILVSILIASAISTLASILGTSYTYELNGSTFVVKTSNSFIDLAGTLLVTGIISYSLQIMALKVADEKSIQMGDMFSGYKKFGRVIALNLLTYLYVFLWSLLFIIPGIIKTFSYALAPYIMEEDDRISPNDAITKSKELMRGHKWQLFCLIFSFIGWLLLGVITVGIVLIWVEPYMEVAVAKFYRDLVPLKEPEEDEFEDKHKFEDEEFNNPEANI